MLRLQDLCQTLKSVLDIVGSHLSSGLHPRKMEQDTDTDTAIRNR